MRLVFLIALTTLNLSCVGFPELPDLHPFDVDIEHGVCGEFRVVDKEKLTFEWVADHDLSKCNGFFALSPEDMNALKSYLKEARRTWEKKCK